MEILVPGLILVALMVYASTKIKKRAAAAYEQESYAGDGFSIVKPEGFIIPAEMPAGLEFNASSKEYGRDEADAVRQVNAEVRRHRDKSLEDLRTSILSSAVEIVEEFTEKFDENNYWIAETRKSADGISTDVFYKVFEKNPSVYELRVTALAEHKDEISNSIETLMDSFTAK